MDEVLECTANAYFRWRRNGTTIHKVAQALAMSPRQTFRRKKLADQDAWATQMALAEVPRKILEELAGGAKTLEQLAKAVGATTRASVMALIAEGAITQRGQRYVLAKSLTRLVNPNGLQFLDGIRFALVPVVHTVMQRVEDDGGDVRTSTPNVAIARIFAFAAAPERLNADADLVVAELLRRVTAIDERPSAAPKKRAYLSMWMAEDRSTTKFEPSKTAAQNLITSSARSTASVTRRRH